ncbi:hypothetical protein ACFFGV_05850 [Pontibacillus salicampi]|uniref:Uncharacterized protein n=1 Tax=Pontibacillus salicampi TaxID=1449801 RepID=A0ABV6LL30_9BACI
MTERYLKDQANALRDRTNGEQLEEASSNPEFEAEEVDVLDLPPRSKVHTGKTNQKNKLTVSKVLLIVFLLLLILIPLYIFYMKDALLTNMYSNLNTVTEQAAHEQTENNHFVLQNKQR